MRDDKIQEKLKKLEHKLRDLIWHRNGSLDYYNSKIKLIHKQIDELKKRLMHDENSTQN